jgi:hypothetical protein
MSRALWLLLVPALAWADEPALPAPDAAPPAEAAPADDALGVPAEPAAPESQPEATELAEKLRVGTSTPIEGLATGLSAEHRASLADVRDELLAAIPSAQETVALSERVVSEKRTALQVANMTARSAKSEWKAAKISLKANDATPGGQDGAWLRGALDASTEQVRLSKIGIRVAKAELVWAKAQRVQAKAALVEDRAKLEEAQARLDEAGSDVVAKLEKARLRADASEAKAREAAAKAKLKLEKVRLRN